MIKGIDLKIGDKTHEFYELTRNTVILCNNGKNKSILTNALLEIEGIKSNINFLPMTILHHSGQQFMLTLDPMNVVLQSIRPNDVWFWDGEELYPLSSYEGYKRIYKDLYKDIVQGRVGCYTGEYLKEVEE